MVYSMPWRASSFGGGIQQARSAANISRIECEASRSALVALCHRFDGCPGRTRRSHEACRSPAAGNVLRSPALITMVRRDGNRRVWPHRQPAPGLRVEVILPLTILSMKLSSGRVARRRWKTLISHFRGRFVVAPCAAGSRASSPASRRSGTSPAIPAWSEPCRGRTRQIPRRQRRRRSGRPCRRLDLVKRILLPAALPGVLTSGRRTGRYEILDKPSQWRNGMISRSDVAEFLVRQIEDRTYVRRAPVLIYG